MSVTDPPPRRSAFGPELPADVRVPGAILRVDGLDAPGAEAVGREGSIELLEIGPRIWLAVSERGSPEDVGAAVAAAAAEGAVACTDLTHARVVFRLAGPAARARLARGCPVDLDTIACGGAAATVLGPFEVVIRRGHGSDTEAFDVFVSRSVARSVRRWLYAIDLSV